MALSEPTLKALLLALPLGTTEPPAVEAWSEAFTTYFEDAVSTPSSIPVIVVALRNPTTGPKVAMVAALTGQLKSGGPAALQLGIQAFWSVINVTPSLFFATAIPLSLPPVGLLGLGAILAATGVASTAQALVKDQAVGNIATDIHAAQAGGTFSKLPGPTVETIT